MGEIIFAKTRHNYESYVDYHELIRLSGFKEIYVDEIPREGVKDNVYICTPLNGEWENGIQTDARVILYDLEYHLDGIPPLANVELWAADAWYARQINAQYVPMGSHPGLALSEDTVNSTPFDVAFLGYMIPRRERIYHELKQAGVVVSPPHAWGAERHSILRNSRLYGHIHQWEHIPTVAPLRVVVAAAYKLPFVTENCADMGIFNQVFYHWDYADYTKYVATTVFHDSQITHFGWALHNLLCERLTFRKSVEDAL